jgi:Protein of unknown function (DUF998)
MGTVTGVVGLAGVVGAVASLLALHLLPTGLSPLRNAVSQYGISDYRLGYRIATICTGVAGIAVATGVASEVRGQRTVVVALLVAFGTSRLVISWFPMDTPGTPATVTGRRHGLLAVIAFTSVTLASLRLPGALSASHQWSGVVPGLRAVGWYLVATVIAMVTARRTDLRQYFGAVERGFYVGMLVFVALVAGALIKY